MGITKLLHRAVVFVGLISTAFCCQKSQVKNPVHQSDASINNLDGNANSLAYLNAYEQGKLEAYAEIANNRITRYVYGKGNWGEKDPETGVWIKVIAGCIVNDSIEGLAQGHNDIILKYLNHEIK